MIHWICSLDWLILMLRASLRSFRFAGIWLTLKGLYKFHDHNLMQ